ncbi:hypothetical protein R3I93_004629 [Phoxinus phoxinus]|uniref:PHD-type domain-containing protein n=1 Tax=Phoxinus phoxinus TaxID=58324 RepID=A0AAN9DHW0_9TELE
MPTALGTPSTPSDSQTPSVAAQDLKTASQDKDAFEKGRKPQRAQRQKSHGPLWIRHSPKDVIQATKLKFPHIDGFQSSLLYQTLHQGGVVGTPQAPFVQILNINDNHWITASNLFCGPNKLCLYDSLKTIINQQTKQKLSWLIRPKTPHFDIQKPAVQIQRSSSNCGLFALAFATLLGNGVKPEECQCVERNMRQTLYRAFQNKKAPVFAYKKNPAKPERETIQVEVHCICRTSHYNEVMVQCSNCNWYHPNCESVPHKGLDTTAEEWNCEICTNHV